MGLHHDILSQPVSSLSLRKAPIIDVAYSVRDTTTLMRDQRLGCVFLADADNHPTAMFTERMFVRLLATGPAQLDDPITQHAIDIANLVHLTDPITSIISQMDKSGFRFTAVIDEQNKLVGLTGQRGIMEYIAENFPRHVKVHLMESKLHMDQREGA